MSSMLTVVLLTWRVIGGIDPILRRHLESNGMDLFMISPTFNCVQWKLRIEGPFIATRRGLIR